MFSIEKNNQKIGAYLRKIINKRYESERQFCQAYLRLQGIKVNDEETRKMQNRFSQILNGKKAIQTYDLPFVSELLGVSCEEILSAGKHYEPTANHITNYEIAKSEKRSVWEKYLQREDKLFLNCDEYCKTVLDYAFEFKNYKFIQYLIEKGYISFESYNYVETGGLCFLADTTIKPDMRRQNNYPDLSLQSELNFSSELRIKILMLAIENGDISVLEAMKARIIPEIYQKSYALHCGGDIFKDSREPAFLETLAFCEDEKIIDYFSDEYTINCIVNDEGTFMFAFISEVIDIMLDNQKYATAEIYIERAIKHNKKTYEKMSRIIRNANPIYCKMYHIEPTDEQYNQKKSRLCTYYYNSFNNIVYLFTHFGENGDAKVLTNIVSVKSKNGTASLKKRVFELNRIHDDILSLKSELEGNNDWE